MDVPPLSPASGFEPDPPSPAATGSGAPPFVLGQRLLAQVVQTPSPEQAVLELGGQRFLASTPQPLSPGQVLDVTVRAMAPMLELVVSAPSVSFSAAAYALAALLTARGERPAGAPVTPEAVRAFLGMLASAADGNPVAPAASEAAAHARLAQLLLPLDIRSLGASLPDALRQLALQAGVPLEARVAARLGQGRLDRGSGAAIPEDDARMLLARLGNTPSPGAEFAELRQRLADEVIGRQIETALHRVKDGEWRVDIPILAGQAESEARLRVRRDADGAREWGRRSGHAFELTVTHPDLGPIQASVTWTPPSLQIRLAARAEGVDVLQGEAPRLVSALRGRGFADVGVQVEVAAIPALPPPEPPETLPGGSILRVRA